MSTNPINPVWHPTVFLQRRRPPGMPETYWKEASWLRLGMFSVAIVVPLLVVLILSSLLPKWWGFVALLCASLNVIGPMLHHRAIRARVRRFDGMVCTRCGYALKALPAVHRCPECSLPFEIDSVREAWALWFGPV